MKDFLYQYIYYVCGATSYFLALALLISLSSYLFMHRLSFSKNECMILNCIITFGFLQLDTMFFIKLFLN